MDKKVLVDFLQYVNDVYNIEIPNKDEVGNN